MLFTSLGFFSLAAILGILLISYVLSNKNTPKGVVFAHGSVAAVGIILLIMYAFFHSPAPWISIILFILAACGGFLLVYRDIMGKSIPKWLAIGHGLTAITAFVFLLVFTFLSGT